MKKKLKLNDLKIQSFVTELEKKQNQLKGGYKDPSLQAHCSNVSCGIVRCTYTLDLEC
jgi:hypothetical protein